MRLFFQKLTGKLLSTEKFENLIAQRAIDIKHYREVESSNELQEMQQLKTVVTTTLFEQNKQTLLHRKYKDTPEYQTMREYEELNSNRDLQLYLRVRESEQLKDFLQFLQTEEAIGMADRKARRKSPLLQKMYAYSRSKAYKAFVRFDGTDTPDKYLQLKKEVETDDFKQRHSFWANAKRWYTTEEYKQEKRYQELAANPDIVWFMQTDKKMIEYYESFTETFTENFDWNTLDKSKWQSGFKYEHTGLKAHHSYTSQQQAYVGGKNTRVQGGTLHLRTLLESVKAPAWDEKKGFVDTKFSYTSDVIQTADNFRQKGGLIMAKIRFTGKVHHAFWLGTEKPLPRTTIVHAYGRHLSVGKMTKNGRAKEEVSGLNPAKFFVYTLEWTEQEMVWYINNMEVFRTSTDIPREEMYLAFSSWLNQGEKGSTGEIEVDWVKVFSMR